MYKPLWLLISVLLVVPMPGVVGWSPAGPSDQSHDRRFSQVELALLKGLRTALRDDAVRATAHAYVLRQLRTVPPVAWVEGYWATPFDVVELLHAAPVRTRVAAAIPRSAAGDSARALLNDRARLKQLVAFAFSPAGGRELLGVPYVGPNARRTTDEVLPAGVWVVPVKDVEWAVAERIPPYPLTTPEADLECYFFCGDPATWDFDRDGMVNVLDDDDDGDGVVDVRDAYPYWPGGSSCACAGREFVGYTEAFSVGITNAVLAAFESVSRPGAADRAVSLGAVPGVGEVRLVLPIASSVDPAAPRPDVCPDATDPHVRYVSTDPAACAAIRFRCEAGSEPFSNACGCGCRPSR